VKVNVSISASRKLPYLKLVIILYDMYTFSDMTKTVLLSNITLWGQAGQETLG